LGNWYDSESAQVPLANQKNATFITPVLSKSKTYFVSVANGLGCEGSRTPVLAEITQFESAEIHTNGDLLISNYAEGNQWYFDTALIAGETKQSVKADKSGIYKVLISTNGCNTSADYHFVIAALEHPGDQSIAVFPNPVKTEASITIPAALKNITGLRIINMAGVSMNVIPLEPSTETRTKVIDMSNYPTGVYILQGIGAMGKIELKVIKQ
jgi:hypothetical protein